MKYIRNILLAATLTLFSMDALAQDLIARQAPVDRKLKSVDSLALQDQIRAEQALLPGIDVYDEEWSNEFVQAYSNAKVPDTYTFDLRGYCMPTPSTRITDVFGYRPRRRRRHYGLDIKVYTGDSIRAAFDGKVRIVKNQGRRGYGKYIVIRHPNGLETVYGHLSKQLVTVNQNVKAGDIIGLGGSTGRSTGSHLHFETRFLGIAINPAYMFDFERQDIVADTYTFRKGSAGTAISGGGARTATASVAGNNQGAFYKVKQGDTLSKIAAKHGVTVAKLCQLNGLTQKSILRPGQVLRCS